MNKTTTWVLILVALLVGGVIGFLFERQRATGKMEAYKMESQKMVDSAKMQQAAMTVSPTVVKSDVVNMATNAKLGTYVTAGNGMALYTYDKDTKGVSNCTGQCAVAWPPYTTMGNVTMFQEHMGAIKLADGSMQYTWDDKPLYFYAKDKDKEDVYGDGVGGVWHVAK